MTAFILWQVTSWTLLCATSHQLPREGIIQQTGKTTGGSCSPCTLCVGTVYHTVGIYVYIYITNTCDALQACISSPTVTLPLPLSPRYNTHRSTYSHTHRYIPVLSVSLSHTHKHTRHLPRVTVMAADSSEHDDMAASHPACRGGNPYEINITHILHSWRWAGNNLPGWRVHI